MSAEFPLRTDTYQTGKSCAAVMYIRGHTVENIETHAEVKSLTVEAVVDGEKQIKIWAWNGETKPETVKIDQGKVKIEFVLEKQSQAMWPKVLADEAIAAPLYEKWRRVNLPTEEEEKNEGIDNFLSKIYANADDDSKRAMLKSMYESHGTVLNCNWGEVGKKTVEPYKSDEDKKQEDK